MNHGAHAQVLAVDAHAFFDLRRQFAGGGQDQRADGARGLASARCSDGGWGLGLAEQLQQGQCEASGLASAGLSASQQVDAAEHQGDGLCLDGRGGGVTGFCDGSQDGLGQAQRFKRHGGRPLSGVFGDCAPPFGSEKQGQP